jgi:hypothetical protein
MFTKTYGIAPSNTTLTVRYLTGGGATANVPANSLTNLSSTTTFLNSNLNTTTANTIFGSLAVTNPIAASGGGDGDTIEEIRQNASANFATQLRNVTQDDYLVRALSMPAKYGIVSKAFIEPTKAQSISAGESNSILDLYILSYDINQKLAVFTVNGVMFIWRKAGAIPAGFQEVTDYRGKTVFGMDATQTEFAVLGAFGGNKNAVVVAHNHVVSIKRNTNDFGVVGLMDRAAGGGDENYTTTTVGESGVGKNLPPYGVIRFIEWATV